MLTAVQAVEATLPEAPVRVWAEDEHRLGLKPVLKRIWARRGSQPLALVGPRYQWLYVVSFVEPERGETFWLLLPTMTVPSFQHALDTFALQVGIDRAHPVVLVLDQAGWHRSPHLRIPDGLHLVFLPAYSPELQPVERLWSLVDEPIVNRVVATLDDLADLLVARCQRLRTMRAVVQARTTFHWWPRRPTSFAH